MIKFHIIERLPTKCALKTSSKPYLILANSPKHPLQVRKSSKIRLIKAWNQSPVCLYSSNMFRNILYSDIDWLAEFDVLIQSGFKNNLKTAFTNLCKTSSCHNNSIF